MGLPYYTGGVVNGGGAGGAPPTEEVTAEAGGESVAHTSTVTDSSSGYTTTTPEVMSLLLESEGYRKKDATVDIPKARERLREKIFKDTKFVDDDELWWGYPMCQKVFRTLEIKTATQEMWEGKKHGYRRLLKSEIGKARSVATSMMKQKFIGTPAGKLREYLNLMRRRGTTKTSKLLTPTSLCRFCIQMLFALIE